jgi:hypothetical protein
MVRNALSLGEVPRSRFDSFGKFTDTAAWVLSSLGFPGTVMVPPADSSLELDEKYELLELLWDEFGDTEWSAADLWKVADPLYSYPKTPLQDWAIAQGIKSPRNIAALFRYRVDQWVDGRVLRKREVSTRRFVYKVEKAP